MKGIVTVIGKDKVGIIADVCSFMKEENINVLDISQTIVKGYFNMMMIVDLENSKNDFLYEVDEIKKLGENIGVDIRLQHEDIFNSMHRI